MGLRGRSGVRPRLSRGNALREAPTHNSSASPRAPFGFGFGIYTTTTEGTGTGVVTR